MGLWVREQAITMTLKINTQSKSDGVSLLLAGPVEEVGPFGAGLLAADPENC